MTTPATSQLTRSPSTAPATGPTAALIGWSLFGALCLVAQTWIALRWLSQADPHIVLSRDPQVSSAQRGIDIAIQTVVVVTVVVVTVIVIRGWRRTGHATADAALYTGYLFGAWTDGLINYRRPAFVYNRDLLHVTSWGPAIPGWNSTGRHQQVEPLLVVGAGFLIVMPIIWLAAAALRRIADRHPTWGPVRITVAGAATVALIDLALEIPYIRTGAFAYPYAIRPLSLFAGHWYQYPLSEALLAGTTLVGPAAVLLHFHHRRSTSVFRTAARLAPRLRTPAVLLSGIGIVNAMMLAFTVLTALLSLAGGPPPHDLPAFLTVE